MNEPRDDNPPTLDYAPPPKHAMGAMDVVALIVGTIGGIVTMGFVGLILGTLRPPTNAALSHYAIAAILFALGISAGVARFKAGRSSSPDRFLVMGLSTGWCITAIIAGVGSTLIS